MKAAASPMHVWMHMYKIGVWSSCTCSSLYMFYIGAVLGSLQTSHLAKLLLKH
jgi:hypothetical protein